MADIQIYFLFGLFVLVQLSTARKRLTLPALRGSNWYFGVPVGSGFYSGEGRRILRNYRLWVLAPYLAEAIGVLLILRFGRPMHLVYLMFALAVVIIGNSMVAAVVTSKQARRFEVPSTTPTVTAVALPLKPRRLADYTGRRFEVLLGASNLVGLVYLVYAAYTSLEPGAWRGTLGAPLLFLYLQAGMFLAKRALVAWRVAVPADDAEPYLAWREHARRFWIETCDFLRAGFAALVVTFAVVVALDLDVGPATWTLLAATFLFLGVWVVWYSRRRNLLLKEMSRVRPIRMPAVDSDRGAGRPFCYLPERPAMLVKASAGYSLNLASRRTQIGAAYLAGFVAIFAAMRG